MSSCPECGAPTKTIRRNGKYLEVCDNCGTKDAAAPAPISEPVVEPEVVEVLEETPEVYEVPEPTYEIGNDPGFSSDEDLY